MVISLCNRGCVIIGDVDMLSALGEQTLETVTKNVL
jgi:hypothetical protein